MDEEENGRWRVGRNNFVPNTEESGKSDTQGKGWHCYNWQIGVDCTLVSTRIRP